MLHHHPFELLHVSAVDAVGGCHFEVEQDGGAGGVDELKGGRVRGREDEGGGRGVESEGVWAVGRCGGQGVYVVSIL